jgi:hypothetical protein
MHLLFIICAFLLCLGLWFCATFSLIYLVLLLFSLFFFAGLYVVEFQKRGLPHTHTLIWLKRNTKEPSSALIDGFIFTELPDPEKDTCSCG